MIIKNDINIIILCCKLVICLFSELFGIIFISFYFVLDDVVILIVYILLFINNVLFFVLLLIFEFKLREDKGLEILFLLLL